MTDPALSSPIAVAVHVQEAERPRYARDDAAGQQCEIENPLACRTFVRRAKGSEGAIHQNYRDRPSDDQDRIGQSRLQHQSPCATSPSHDRLVLRKATHSTHHPIAIRPNQQPVSADLRHAENNSLIEPSRSVPRHQHRARSSGGRRWRPIAAGGAACRSRAAFRPPNLTGLTVRAVRRTIAADRKEANMAEVDNDAAAELCWKLLLPVLSWPACGGKRTSSRFAA